MIDNIDTAIQYMHQAQQTAFRAATRPRDTIHADERIATAVQMLENAIEGLKGFERRRVSKTQYGFEADLPFSLFCDKAKLDKRAVYEQLYKMHLLDKDHQLTQHGREHGLDYSRGRDPKLMLSPPLMKLLKEKLT